MALEYRASVTLDTSIQAVSITLNLTPSVDDASVYIDTQVSNVVLPVYRHDSTDITGSTQITTANELSDATLVIQPSRDSIKSVTIDPYLKKESFTLNVLPVIEVPFIFRVDTSNLMYSGYDWITRNSNTGVINIFDETEDRVQRVHWKPTAVVTAGASVISSSSTQYVLPTVEGGNYDCVVSWGDGTSSSVTSWNDADVLHTYASPGVYTISIVGQFEGINFHRHVAADGGPGAEGGTYMDCRKLLEVSNWGLKTILDLSSLVPSYLSPNHTEYQESYSWSPGGGGGNLPAKGLPFNGCVNWNSTATAPPNFGYVEGTSVQKSYDPGHPHFGIQPLTGKWFVGSNADGIFQGNNNLNCDLSNWGSETSPLTGSMYSQFNQRVPTGTDVKANWFFRGQVGYLAWNGAIEWNNSIRFQQGTIKTNSTVGTPGDVGTIGDFADGTRFDHNGAQNDHAYINNVTNFDVTNWREGDPIGGTSYSLKQVFSNLTAFDGDVSNLFHKHITSAASTFSGCTSFTGKGVETWDTESVTTFEDTFNNCKSFNKPLSHLKLVDPNSSATLKMNSFLSGCDIFNHDCSAWDTSRVSQFGSVFRYDTAFNNGGASWTDADFRNCTTFAALFDRASSFNADVSRWRFKTDPSSVSMFRMFSSTPFNKPIATTEVDGIKYWDTSGVYSMSYMFESNINFNQPIDNWDVSGVRNFERMFQSSASVDAETGFNQDLSSWDTTSGNNFKFMLSGARSFDGDISGWRFREDEDIQSYQMLGNTPSLFEGSKDLSGWNTKKFNNLTGFFYSGATERIRYWGANDPSKLTYEYNGRLYFPDWSPNVGGWDVGNSTSFSNTFFTCGTFNDDISGWNVSKGTSFNRFVKGCFLFDRNLSSWDMSSAVDMHEMFMNCVAFNNGGSDGIKDWDISSCTDIAEMFSACHVFNQPLTNWDTSNVTTMDNVFISARAFNQDLITDGNKWNTSNVTSMYNMFTGASVFDGSLSGWDVSKVTTMSSMFNAAAAFTGQGINSWNVGACTDMLRMFTNCPLSSSVDLSSWDVSSVTTLFQMFINAASFNSNLSSWNLSSISTDPDAHGTGKGALHEMFKNCGMSKSNLDATLQGWCANSNTPSGLHLGTIPLNGTTETLDSATTTAMKDNKSMTALYANGNAVYS